MTEEEFNFALAQVLEAFGVTKVGSNTVRSGVALLRAERDTLRQRVEFESHKCSKCGSNLGLLHEDACPLCNCRKRVAELEGLHTEVDTLMRHYHEEMNACERELAAASKPGDKG